MARNVVCALICCAFFSTLLCQNSIPVSKLRQQALRADHPAQLSSLNELAQYFIESNPDSARHYAYIARNLAIKNQEALALAYANRTLARFYSRRFKFDSVQYLSQQGLKISLGHPDTVLRAHFFLQLGSICIQKEKYDSALWYYNQITNLFKEDSCHQVAARAHSNKGMVYNAMGEYAPALKYHLYAHSCMEANQDTVAMARNALQLGSIYGNLEIYKKAYAWYQTALQLNSSTGKNAGIELFSYQDIALILIELKDYNQARIYLDKAYAVFNNEALSDHLSFLYSDYIHLFTQSEQFDSLRFYVDKGLDYAVKSGNREAEVSITHNKCLYYLQKSSLDSALNCANKAVMLIQEYKMEGNYPEVFQSISKIYVARKEFEKAYYFDTLYHYWEDQKQVQHSTNELMALELELKNQEQKNYIQYLAKQNQVQEESLTTSKYLLGLSFLLGCILATLAIVFFMRFRHFRHLNYYLEQSREEVSQKNSELKLRERQLDRKNHILAQTNEELRQFAYASSHDLKEPLRMISSYISLLEKRVGSRLGEDADTYLHYIKDGASRMNRMLADLLTYALIGQEQEEQQMVNLNDTISEALENLKLAIQEEEVQVDVEALPVIEAIPTSMLQVFQNLIGNAIKFRGSESPKIHIGVQNLENQYIFSVGDNGIGIPEEYQQRIFQIFQRLHNKGDYKGSGIGLAICQKVINRMGGKIWLESTVGKGTTFYFSIPVQQNSADPV